MTYHYANLRYSDSILRKGYTNMIYLTDNPHDISKQHLINISRKSHYFSHGMDRTLFIDITTSINGIMI